MTTSVDSQQYSTPEWKDQKEWMNGEKKRMGESIFYRDKIPDKLLNLKESALSTCMKEH